jgi:hypothetical protein
MTDEGGVLGNLPNSRPGKRSAKRDRPAKAAKKARSSKAASPRRRTTAVKGAGSDAPVAVDREYRGKVQPEPAEPSGDALGAVVRNSARLGLTGFRVAGALTQELLRRLPRP